MIKLNLKSDYESDGTGEIQGIGFDDNRTPDPTKIFNLAGNENWGDQTYTYTGGRQRFTIPVGQLLGTLQDQYLIVVNDNDSATGINQSWSRFSNIRLCSVECEPIELVLYDAHTSHLNQITKLTRMGLNEIGWDVNYTAFGEIVSANGDAVTQPLSFPGQRRDLESGYTYNYFRDYDPSLGRYIQSDPIGLDGGLNTYGYVNGNPVNAVDPLGLKCKSASGITTCTPENTAFNSFSFGTPRGWDAFESSDFFYHGYTFIDYVGNLSNCNYGDSLKNELIKSPTNDSNAATSEGNLNDVGPLHPGSKIDNVLSYATTDGIANVTQENHAVGSGFVVRKIVWANGGYAILTYGEGNSWKQIVPGADGLARDFWTENAEVIRSRAIQNCECNY